MTVSPLCSKSKDNHGDLASNEGRMAQMKPIPPLRTLIVNDYLLDFRLTIWSTSKVVSSPARI
jgi:hypothetical protein